MNWINKIGRVMLFLALVAFGFAGVANAQTLSAVQSGGSVQVNTAIASSISASCNTASVTVPYVAGGVGVAPAFTCTAAYNVAAGSGTGPTFPPAYGVITDLFFTTSYALTGPGGNIPLANFLLSIDGGTATACNQGAMIIGYSLGNLGQLCTPGDAISYNASIGPYAPLQWSSTHSYVAEINFAGLGSLGVSNYSGNLNFEMYFIQ